MTQAASNEAMIDGRILDELVPPPGPRWRRALLWVAFLGTVGAFGWATTSGTVIPQVQTGIEAWGGSGPVGVTIWMRNDSRVDIVVVEGPRARPGLSSLGYTTGNLLASEYVPAEEPGDPFPVRLAPDESLRMTAWFRVTDCRAIEEIDSSDDAIDVQVRIADGPASRFTAERTIETTDLGAVADQQVSWPSGIATFACNG